MPARALINTIRPRASRVVRSYILSYYSIHRRDNGRIRTFRTLRPRRNPSHRGHITQRTLDSAVCTLFRSLVTPVTALCYYMVTNTLNVYKLSLFTHFFSHNWLLPLFIAYIVCTLPVPSAIRSIYYKGSYWLFPIHVPSALLGLTTCVSVYSIETCVNS